MWALLTSIFDFFISVCYNSDLLVETHLLYWETTHLTLSREKHPGHTEWQPTWPYWGTNNLLYWGTIRSTLLRDKYPCQIEWESTWPFWRTNNLTLLRGNQVDLFEGQTDWPFCVTINLTLMRKFKMVQIFGEHGFTTCTHVFSMCSTLCLHMKNGCQSVIFYISSHP